MGHYCNFKLTGFVIAGRGCFKCGEDGHMARDCTNEQSSGGSFDSHFFLMHVRFIFSVLRAVLMRKAEVRVRVLQLLRHYTHMYRTWK